MTQPVEQPPRTVLVDTDVVSFDLRHDSRALLYARHMVGRRLAISFMTLAEIYRWALQVGIGPERTARMNEHLRDFAILPGERNVCRLWAEVMIAGRSKGRVIAPSDAWIAATALQYGLPLVTHNARHFADLEGLVVLTEGPV